MSRIPFSQMLKKAGTDIRREYDRLYALFYIQKIPRYGERDITLRDFCAISFLKFPIRETCISLNDFDDSNDFCFKEDPLSFDLDYLVSFCEYSYNLVEFSVIYNSHAIGPELNTAIQFYLRQLDMVVEAIGYLKNKHDCVTDLVPKDQAVISVAEIVDPELSYKVIEYNHHSMKGDLERKRATLLVLADKLEAQREKLNHTSASLKSDIFMLLNNMNIRHNNTDPNSKYYISFVAAMKKEEIEHWYDELYQMCLLAFLELDHSERKGSIEQMKQDIQTQ